VARWCGPGRRAVDHQPQQEHWHGAAPDSFMEHLAMLDQGDDPATSTT
jgi:quercetin dioxygenase-like cupin family protein